LKENSLAIGGVDCAEKEPSEVAVLNLGGDREKGRRERSEAAGHPSPQPSAIMSPQVRGQFLLNLANLCKNLGLSPKDWSEKQWQSLR